MCVVISVRSVGTVHTHAWIYIAALNQFIDGNLLVDLPLRGRSYTWFWGDGRSMSRIDWFLLFESWCLTWPNCFHMALARGLSDHCLLELSVDDENWGLKFSRL